MEHVRRVFLERLVIQQQPFQPPLVCTVPLSAGCKVLHLALDAIAIPTQSATTSARLMIMVEAAIGSCRDRVSANGASAALHRHQSGFVGQDLRVS